MYTGHIIHFFEHKELVSGICLGQEDDRILVLCGNGREVHINVNRIVHASAGGYDPIMPFSELLKELGRRDEQRQALMHQICAETLWDAVKGAGLLFEIGMLARVVFGDTVRPEHESAVLYALVQDRIYFKLQGSRFLAVTPEQAEKQKNKIEKVRQRQITIRESIAWLQSILHGREATASGRESCMDFLKSYAVFGKESPYYNDAREVFAAVGIDDPHQCFDILVKIGIWDEDENIFLQRHALPLLWPEQVRDQVAALDAKALGKALADAMRTDLTHLRLFSIDDPFTRDIDDALSVQFFEDYTLLGIHIADVSVFIPAESPLDQEALHRGTTVYLPDAKIPMIPQAVSEQMASLRDGETRPAVSFFVKLSHTGEILEYTGVQSIIRVAEKLSYSEVDAALERDEVFSRLYQLACMLRGKRIASGAVWFLTPELQVRVDRGKEIFLKIRDKESGSQILVSECMILANYCASRIFQEHACPALFRKQAQTAEKNVPSGMLSLFQIFSYRKKFNRVVIDAHPGTHGSLGLESYVSITSPLRKYCDLINQRQLVSLLKGWPPVYSRRDLKTIITRVQPALTKAAIVEQERKRYWLLKALRHRVGQKFDALVLEKTLRAYTILLLDYLFESSLNAPEENFIAPGDTVSVILENADPFCGTLQVRLA